MSAYPNFFSSEMLANVVWRLKTGFADSLFWIIGGGFGVFEDGGVGGGSEAELGVPPCRLKWGGNWLVPELISGLSESLSV